MNLRERVLSEENIYNAIYALESYISERDLLSTADVNRFISLRDKYNFTLISEIISECKGKLTEILDKPSKLFEVNVYFKLKKFDKENSRIEYRPLHTAELTDQICMAALLMPIMFDDSNGKRTLSELSRMLPHNFYGNIPSCNVQSIFMNWTEKYRQYTHIINSKSREYSKTREYDKEISFDLKDFFPSISPRKILDKICNAISKKYDSEDNTTLKTIVTKLLYFKIPEQNLKGWYDTYFKDTGKVDSINGFYPTRGIAQGLPQSYFFGNLCMIDIAEKMNRLEELGKTDSFFYVDDSVVFARNIDANRFQEIINSLNNSVAEDDAIREITPTLAEDYFRQADILRYKVEFHTTGKSTICDIDDAFNGMDGLFDVQRRISMGGWIKGNLDEVDDNVALKKLNVLQTVIDDQLDKIKGKIKKYPNLKDEYETRLKWLKRYRRYFIFRQRKLQVILNGAYDKALEEHFFETFKVNEVLAIAENNGKITDDFITDLFEVFEEDIFKSEFELILSEMPQESRMNFCDKIMRYDKAISDFNSMEGHIQDYLYYYHISYVLGNIDINPIGEYDTLSKIIRKTRTFRNSEKFIETLKTRSEDSDDVWKVFVFLNQITHASENAAFNIERDFPDWCGFVFHNSDNFRRKILNCCFSYACNIMPGDNLSILRTDIKPVKYYELRLITMLRNSRLRISDFFEFLRRIDCHDINERMEIDLGILEGLGIFRQRVHDPFKIDRLIQTHRLVKSLWHNGSKFLNAYTLHNHEHAINLIKNVVRLVNNVDFLNLKSNDFFLLFNACYLHDISMVIHPNIALFNDPNTKSELLVSKWTNKIIDICKQLDNSLEYDKFKMNELHKLRKTIGLSLVEAFNDVFDFFEDRVRGPHAFESAKFIRSWQDGMLSYLSELEAEYIATISESHGWELSDVYEMKSSAKDELVSLKYMMILIRLADLLDLANDRIDYFLLKQNRSQMNSISRYHWISHLITDKYELDVDFKPVKDVKLTEYPIHENIHLDIFLNSEILVQMKKNKKPCMGIEASIGQQKQERYHKDNMKRSCIEFQVGRGEMPCNSAHCSLSDDGKSRSCPFLCIWMSDKHWWLFSELGKLKHYLNSVNSKLIKSDITVRFFFDNCHKLDSEFFDDVKNQLIK